MAFTDTHLEHFERDYGCTPSEWLGWMPEATQGHAWRQLNAEGLALPAPRADAQGQVCITLPGGQLSTRWQVLEPRRIALISLPRMRVSFQFSGVDLATRQAFMRVFDLHLQRGGG